MQGFRKLNVTSIEGGLSSMHDESNSIHLSDNKAPDEYWIVKDSSQEILITNEQYGLSPQCYELSDELYCVGVNQIVFIVEFGKIRSELELPCRFYELIYRSRNFLVVYHEIGFVCLTIDGDILWEEGGDLIENWRIDNDQLTFKTWAGKKTIGSAYTLSSGSYRVPVTPEGH